MAIYQNPDVECKGCGVYNLELFDSNDKCIVCTRLDNIEKKIKEMKKEK